jgi:hypothetical protein
VSITADVEDIHSASVFALDEDKLWSTGRDVLVVARDLKKPMTDDMYVTVVGKVKRFSTTGVELEGYDLNLRPNLATGFRDRPVIIATSIRTAAGEELLGAT